MKTLFLLPVSILSLSFAGSNYFSLKPCLSIKTDSSIIIHKLDGIVDEWPADKFSADKGTSI